jgi:hypothetical protein
VLYAPVPHTSSIENDFRAVRCYAAIAAESSRVLVLVDAPSKPSSSSSSSSSRGGDRPPVTHFVVPETTFQWRRVNQNDDARVRKGDMSWCADLSRHGAALTAATATEALQRRFKSERRACVGAVSAASDCGAGNDSVRMVLTAHVENMLDDLPSTLMDLVNRGDIQASFDVPAVAEMGASDDATQDDDIVVQKDDDTVMTDDDVNVEDGVSDDVMDTVALTVNTHEGHPETKRTRLRAQRSSKTIDSSRALIVFGISVGLVGMFINVFARRTSKQDELACLMVDGVSAAPYAASTPPNKTSDRRDRRNSSKK